MMRNFAPFCPVCTERILEVLEPFQSDEVLTVPGGVSFEDTCVGETSTETLYVCNTGSENLEVSGITSSDSRFIVVTPSSGFPVTISPDFCFPFQVQFTPTGVGAATATISVDTTTGDASCAAEIEASGEGIDSNIVTLIADNGDFGDVCRDTIKDLTLVISNSGGCDLSVSNITSSSPDFVVATVEFFPLVVGPGDSVKVPIRFAPSTLGAKSGVITIFSDDPDSPSRQVDVSGNVPPGDIVVTGSTDFGDVCPQDLAEKTVSVCNVGLCNLNVSSAAIDCLDFTIINNPFPAAVSHDFCLDLVIRFTPTSAGPKTCTLTIVSDDPDTPIVNLTLTANTPFASIDVPPDLAFLPTVIQSVGVCKSFEAFPVSNTGTCDLNIVNFEITDNVKEYSINGLPSFPIILEPGHIAGEGDLDLVFGPIVLDRNRLGEATVEYVYDGITGETRTEVRNLCGEGVRTGARVLVRVGGTPIDLVKSLKIQRVVGNRNRPILDTVDTSLDLPLVSVDPTDPCFSFQYHKEYGTVSNPIQLLPGNYQVTATVRIGSRTLRRTVGFSVTTCDFNPTIIINF
jgi:hypothetical protein